jgi:hypothetical protein
MTAAAATRPRVELLLIRSEPPCRRCHQAEVVLREIAVTGAGEVTVRVIVNTDDEASRYGAVVTPMTIVNGKIACAGLAPVRSGIERLVQAALTRT